MPHDPATPAASERFAQVEAQATESLRVESRRLHETAEQVRERYRLDLEDWMQLRSRLDRRGGALRPVGTDALRAEYEQRGRELARIQSRLKRLDVVARQLDVLHAYLESPEEASAEPEPLDDASPEATRLRIIDAQEGERQRMAEDIHDGPAQVLTNAIFQVEYLDRLVEADQRDAHSEIAFLRDMLQAGLDEVRGFIADLRPPVVDVGLAAALGERAGQLERHGIAVEIAVDGVDERLTPAQRASVLRIVQEALQNARKHAGASHISIGLEGDALVVADNGRGFDLVRLAAGTGRNFGLQFMRERAELMGGQLQIESRRGEGTRILLQLPAQT